jgi:hypothetical protein
MPRQPERIKEARKASSPAQEYSDENQNETIIQYVLFRYVKLA